MGQDAQTWWVKMGYKYAHSIVWCMYGLDLLHEDYLELCLKP